jgi:hypothetical protein
MDSQGIFPRSVLLKDHVLITDSSKIVFGNASAAAVNEKAILHLFG